MKKPTTAELLRKALAELETLKAQVAALQAQVIALTPPLPYQPYQPYKWVPPPWMPWETPQPFFVPPYDVTCEGSAGVPSTGYTVRKVDGMRLTRGLS